MYERLGKDEPKLDTVPDIRVKLLDVPIKSGESRTSANIYLLTDSNNPFGCNDILQEHNERALEELDTYNNRYLPRGERRVISNLLPIYTEISYYNNLAVSCMAFRDSNSKNFPLADGKFVFQVSDIGSKQWEIFTMNMLFNPSIELKKRKYTAISYKGNIRAPVHNSLRMNIARGISDIQNNRFNGKPFLINNVLRLLFEGRVERPLMGSQIGELN